MSTRFMRRLACATTLCAMLAALATAPAAAGQPPSGTDLSERIDRDIGAVLGRHGLVFDDSELGSWFTLRIGVDLVGIGEVFYLLELHRVDEVPLAARMEIIEYCMRLHAERGVPFLRLQMRAGPRQATLLPPRPAFEMAVGSLY